MKPFLDYHPKHGMSALVKNVTVEGDKVGSSVSSWSHRSKRGEVREQWKGRNGTAEVFLKYDDR